MYLHVGNSNNIRIKDIVGIFDADNATVSQITRKYLSNAEKKGKVVSAKDEVPKSFILYKENGHYTICFSQLSTSALIGRLNRLNEQDFEI